ncbi:unnamed protein product, partial [Prunus brigantina]
LLSFVNGASVSPSPFLKDDKGKLTDAINPAYDTWIQQDQLVLSWINGSLSSTVLATVTRFTSARSTWVALENRFASPNQNRILQLRSELFRTARGDSSIADYLDKVNAIVDNLALSGSPLPDSDLLAVIMNNVGPLYESTIASAQARETPITYADLEALLLSAEQRHLALHAPACDGPATAMVAAHGRAPSRGRGRGSGRFSFRGGHSGGSAPWSGSSSAAGHPGFRGSSSSHGSGRASFSSPGGSSSQPGVLGPPPAAAAGFSSSSASFSGSRWVPPQRLTAMTAQQSSSPRPPNWVVDTGANSHITNDLGNLVFLSRHVIFDEHCFPFQETKGPHAPISSSSSTDSAPSLQIFGSLPNQLAASQPHGHQIVTSISPNPSSPLPTHISSSPHLSSPLPNATSNPTAVASQTTQPSPPSSLQVYRRTPHRTVLTFPSPDPDPVLPSSSRHSSPSATSRVRPSTTHSMVTRAKIGLHKPNPKYAHHAFLDSPKDIVEPTCFSQANKFQEWRTAMGEEFNALQRAGTWVLVPPKPTLNVLPNKWVFRIKRNSDGSVQRYKARLVANGFHQQEGLDYGETFSPVVNHSTIRLILALSVQFQWPVRQLDVQNAFLHGYLDEEVYMRQPPGFIDPKFPDHVCRLKRNDPAHISTLIQGLSRLFSMKDLGPVHYFLGMEILCTPNGLSLTQSKYIKDLLTRTKMQDAKHISSPVASGRRLSLHDGVPLADPSEYRSVVGALQYLTLTRPDIAFAVNHVCQFMHQPTSAHWVAVKRILRYLNGTSTHGLFYKPGSLSLMAYSDADYAGDPDDRHSTGGYCLYLGSNLISWSSKKQGGVSRSSTEAEYRKLAYTAAAISWFRALFRDLQLSFSCPKLWCDNISAISLASNPVFHARTRHVEVDYHYVREKVVRQELDVRYLATHDQIADIFTKGLSIPRFQLLTSKLPMRSSPVSLRGCVR